MMVELRMRTENGRLQCSEFSDVNLTIFFFLSWLEHWNCASKKLIIIFGKAIILVIILVRAIFLYACESWTLTAELQRRMQVMEMRCYRKILRISYKDHVTNEQVRAKIQQAIGPHEDLLTILKRRRLLWYGHVSRSSGLAKTILQGTVKWGRRQSRQRTRCEDNIREWTGLEFAKSQRAVKNREKWRKRCEIICGTTTTLTAKG